MKKIIIIGGGASGLVCAIKSKNNNNEVIILEKNSVCGKKILATGAGRCNYYNDNQDLGNYYSNSKNLDKIITKENNLKVEQFFKELGVVPKIKNGYYYPMSNQASSIRNILVEKVLSKNIKIIENAFVKDVVKENDKFRVFYNSEEIIADKVVLATGSYAGVSDISNSGYDVLNKFNLKIEEVLPSLVQLKAKGNFFKKWNGVRCDAKVGLYEDNNFLKEEIGELQLTDYGISGICIFNLSGYVSRGLKKKKHEFIKIDFLPSIDRLEEFFLKRSETLNNVSIKTFLEPLLNYKLVDLFLDLAHIKKDKLYQELTNDERNALISTIKSFYLELTGTNSYSKAQTCTGGLSLDEVDLSTMEVKQIKNLYVIGELIDVDGICGGYNLTFAWMSGILAGSDISDKS